MKKSKLTVAVVLALIVLGLVSSVSLASDQIIIKGSTTVLPIAQRTAEVFMSKNSGVNMSVQGGGSGVGMAALVDGTTDIAAASRAIKDKELKKAVSNGVTPKANVVAMDGIAVIVNNSNSLKNLSIDQIKAIYTGKISNWSDVGGSGGQIVVISRDSASGTFEAFNSLALSKARVRPDALLSASNQAVAQTVAKTPGAIGYVGLGYVSGNVKAITVNKIECRKETVLTGEYPLARPLFMYTNGKPAGAIKAYLDFVLSKEGQQLIEKEGYIGLK